MKTILVDDVDSFVHVGEGIYQPMYDLLEQYENPKILLTGASDEQMITFGLQDMPYEVFTLKHNPEKTDPLYYETILKHFGFTKGDVVYFEHNPKAVESATSVGIESYFYDDAKKDIVALKEFLDANL